MTDDLGYEDGALTPTMKAVGFALMGLNVAFNLAGWFLAAS